MKLLTVTLSILIISPRFAGAYALEGQRWYSVPVSIQVNLSATSGRLQTPPTFPLQDGSGSWESVYSSVAFVWNQYLAELSFYTYQGSNRSGGATGDSVNEVFFGSSLGGSKLDSSTLALTILSFDPSSNAFVETDTVFNSSTNWNSYRGPLLGNVTDFRRVALHEMGHMLGLDHPDSAGQVVDAIMNSHIGDRDTLSSDDIAGAQSLYGGAVISRAGHFFGPGIDNVLWRNTQNGDLLMWYFNGNALTAQIIAHVPLIWKLAGIGDLNGDGYSDIVWENTLNYELVAWVMRGTSIIQTYVLPYELPVVAIGSFFHDGLSDILLRDPTNGQLYMLVNHGGGSFTEQPVGPAIDLSWTVSGTADVYGNGGSNLFWRNGTSGEIVVWGLVGTSITQATEIGSLDQTWQIADFGDFNGDGKEDILLRNLNSGSVVAWIMSRLSIVSEWFPGAPSLEWRIAGSADINGDSRKDILLMHQPSGSLYLWSGQPTYFNETPYGSVSTVWAVEPASP